MILGTAGHIDHGKTALVRALTGVDTDRLPEEKRRGITIELGFAPLDIEGLGQVGIVDVPGHDAFIRTMVAGASGIDLALVVVAADAGLMPQTHEHLQILQLLGVRHGVVALTKCDLVDDAWLALVEDDVRLALASSSLSAASIVRTSAKSGAGIEALRVALKLAAQEVPARGGGDLFRMPIDRAFTLKGTGTVVTGTVWSGSLTRDASLRIFPGDRVVRVRSLQSHGTAVDAVSPGQRAAIALAGVEVGDVKRGSVVVQGDAWVESRILRARISLAAERIGAIVGPRTRIRFHLGTADHGARLVAAAPLCDGTHQVRVVLDEPIVARMNDRFVLRSSSPRATIGGGMVLDPRAPQRAKPFVEGTDSSTQVLAVLVDEARNAGLAVTDLPVRLGVAPRALPALLSATEHWRVNDRLFSERAREELRKSALANLREFHRANPLESGAPIQWLRSKLGAEDTVVDAVLAGLASGGKLTLRDGVVVLSGFAPSLNEQERALSIRVLQAIETAGVEPPSFAELADILGVSLRRIGDVARLLLRGGSLVAVEADRYFGVAAVTELRARLAAGMEDGAEYTPAEIKEMLHLTRKFTIPFLEYCDRETYTIRGLNGRRLATSKG